MALRASIGQYYSASSPLHRLDPRAKLAATVAFMASCFFVHTGAQLVLAAAAVLAAICAAHVPMGRLLSQIKPIALFLVVTSIVNLFFVQTGAVVAAWGPVSIHAGGVEAAVLYTARFFLLLLAGSLLMLTTTPAAITDAIERVFAPLERLRVPVGQASTILSIALRFVPTLSREAEHILAAQTARGADFENKGALAYARACVPLVVPLFSSALRHADNLGRAMDARCYMSGPARTHYHELKLNVRRDGPFIALVAVYLGVLAIL